MKTTLLTILRDPSTKTWQFRDAARRLGAILAAESGVFLPKKPKSVDTELGHAEGVELLEEPVLVSILRSGAALLDPFMDMYLKAAIGMIGIRRDETSFKPLQYYQNLPALGQNAPIFLLDPMLATGASAMLAVRLLKEAGAEEKQVVFIAILAAKEGLDLFQRTYPEVRMHIAHVDPALNQQKMIVPGLGDFGDRYFAT